MGEILLENKKDKITLTNTLSSAESINERVYNALSSGMFETLLPVTVKEKRKETVLECTARDMMPLCSYYGSAFTKRQFLNIAYMIAQQIKFCEKNMVNADNLDLRSDRIFTDGKTNALKFVLWPIVNNEHCKPAYLFLKQLPDEIAFGVYDDKDYLNEYRAFFENGRGFNINEFERLVSRLKDGQPTESCSDNNGQNGNTGGTMENTRIVPQVRCCENCGAENELSSKFCLKCGSKLGEAVNSAEYTADVNASDNVTAADGSPLTQVLSDNEENAVSAVLLRISTAQAVVINKPVFVIGSRENECDLVISDNKFISRRHAEIIAKNGRYYIVDCGSTNKTYLNGRALPPCTEAEIFKGAKIRLANEDFTFATELR